MDIWSWFVLSTLVGLFVMVIISLYGIIKRTEIGSRKLTDEFRQWLINKWAPETFKTFKIQIDNDNDGPGIFSFDKEKQKKYGLFEAPGKVIEPHNQPGYVLINGEPFTVQGAIDEGFPLSIIMTIIELKGDIDEYRESY